MERKLHLPNRSVINGFRFNVLEDDTLSQSGYVADSNIVEDKNNNRGISNDFLPTVSKANLANIGQFRNLERASKNEEQVHIKVSDPQITKDIMHISVNETILTGIGIKARLSKVVKEKALKEVTNIFQPITSKMKPTISGPLYANKTSCKLSQKISGSEPALRPNFMASNLAGDDRQKFT